MFSSNFGRLLIVDDEVELLHSLAEKLAKQGYETVPCGSPQAALQLLRTQRCDLLLTDLMMPEMDGITLLQAAHQIDPDMAAIVMTGQATVQTAVDALKKGAVDYILKPFKINLVLPALARALELRGLRLENIQLRETVGIYELCKAISFTLDFQTLLNKIADAAMQQCEAEEASIMLPTDEGDELRVSVVRGNDRGELLGECVPFEQGIAGWVARHREPIALTGATAGAMSDPRFTPILTRQDIRASISMPMLIGGNLVGVLNVNSTTRPQPFTLGQVKALSILANTGAAALESAKLHREIGRAEERYRSIFENAKEGILQSSPSGHPQLANPAFARLLGYESPAALLAQVHDMSSQIFSSVEESAAILRQVEQTGQVAEQEVRLVHRDGHRIWVLLSVRAVRDASGKTIMYESTIEDISRRKHAERRTALEHGVARTLAEAATLPEVLPRILQTICDTLDWAWSAAWRIDPQTAVMRCEAVWYPGIVQVNNVAIQNPETTIRPGVGLPGRVWANAEPVWITDLNQESILPGPTTVEGLGLRAAFAFPIVADKHILGVIECASKELREPDLELMAAIRTIGNLIGQFLERKQAEEKLRISQSRLAEILDTAEDAIIVIDEEQHIILFNKGAERIFGYTTAEVVEKSLDLLLPPRFVEAHRGHLLGFATARDVDRRMAPRQDVFGLHKNGHEFPAEASISRQVLDGRVTFTTILRDITDRRKLEEQFRQAQKMEAIGHLAGGVAHDFNNLLTVINGYTEHLLGALPAEDKSRDILLEIGKAGDRAASLTRQLLAFSRKQVLASQVLDLNVLVHEAEKMLRRLIGEDITLAVTLAPNLGAVKADPGQIEQMILNLVVNARDAMPLGGRLSIETKNVELDAAYTKLLSLGAVGPHVLITVRDTGCGMDDTTRGRLFEPFFTTKEVGKGTGLGLATVYGIVKQSGGHIEVESELGQGSTFSIYLPRVNQAAPVKAAPDPQHLPKGTETILMVEDEDIVRSLVGMILQSKGYSVLQARNGEEALRLLDEQGHENIHLLLTDLIMPKMGGRQLAELVMARRPNIKVLYVSGYTDDAVIQHGVLGPDMAFLQKPFTPIVLARKVREVLDQA